MRTKIVKHTLAGVTAAAIAGTAFIVGGAAGAALPPYQLHEGATLDSGQSIISVEGITVNGEYTLRMQPDGNLVEVAFGRTIWQTGTGGNPGAKLVYQTDGNLVVRSTTGKALWSSQRLSGRSGVVKFSSDGSVVRDEGGVIAWSNQAGPVATLPSGQSLAVDWTLASPTAVLQVQSDGNVVERTRANARAIAATNTGGRATSSAAERLNMQSDGNLVLRDSANRAVWSSGTVGHPGATLSVQSDDNVVIRSAQGVALWTLRGGRIR